MSRLESIRQWLRRRREIWNSEAGKRVRQKIWQAFKEALDAPLAENLSEAAYIVSYYIEKIARHARKLVKNFCCLACQVLEIALFFFIKAIWWAQKSVRWLFRKQK